MPFLKRFRSFASDIASESTHLPSGFPPPPIKTVDKLSKNSLYFSFTDGLKRYVAYEPVVSMEKFLEIQEHAKATKSCLVQLVADYSDESPIVPPFRHQGNHSQASLSSIPFCSEPASIFGSRPYLPSVNTAATSKSILPLYPIHPDYSSMRPLRILSVDGGGVRGRAVLEILSTQLKAAGFSEGVRPCEVFDLIGGTSTGGLVALLLGRLGLTIPEAINIYEEVSKKVFDSPIAFQSGRLIARGERFSSKSLKKVMERVAFEYTGNKNELLANPGGAGAKTVVVSNKKDTLSSGVPRFFRSYDTEDEPAASCTIVEAARATSAAPFYFRSQKINGERYVDGGLGTNNPCSWLVNEAGSLWPGRQFGLILSIGTGGKRAKANTLTGLLGITTGTESTHQLLKGRFKDKGVYYRYQVGDLGNEVSLNQWNKMDLIRQRTSDYLCKPEVQDQIERVSRVWASFPAADY